MNGDPRLFRVNPDNHHSEPISEVEFSRLRLQERRDIQEWIAANPVILGEDLLIIGKEFSGFDRTNERLDLLAVDLDGKLVVIELKRDDTGADAHWQAIKYASYFRHATPDDIVSMLSDYAGLSDAEATDQLLHHLQADDFGGLNNDQRIILASHRFAPEVTSAVMWLNEKAPIENLITCIQLVPYHDTNNGTLYVQANTLIPLSGIDEFIVKPGRPTRQEHVGGGSSFASNLKRAYERNKDDAVTHFLKQVGTQAISTLSSDIKQDRKSKWAGRHGDQRGRYYHLWYSSPVWSNWGTSYRVNLYPDDDTNDWQAVLEFRHDQIGLSERLEDVSVHPNQSFVDKGIDINLGTSNLSDDFGDTVALAVGQLIRQVTPIVRKFEDESNEE